MRLRRGFTLVELMIALALGASITGTAISLLVSAIGLHRDLLLTLRSQQDLRLLMEVSLRDVARAGHWRAAGAVAVASQTHDLLLGARTGRIVATAVLPATNTAAAAFTAPLLNAVLQDRALRFWVRNADRSLRAYELRLLTRNSSTQITLDAGSQALPLDRIAAGSWTLVNPFAAFEVEASCLSFSYDEDGDGVQTAQERFGYRFDRRGEALEASNNAAACDSGSWQNVSDERVLRMTQFDTRSRSLPLADPGLRHEMLTLSLAASSRMDRSSMLALQGSVRVRNDALP